MKTFITLSAAVLFSNVALAGAFEHEQRIGSQDLDPSLGVSDQIQNPAQSGKEAQTSLQNWYKGNQDVVHVPYQHDGVEMSSDGDMFTSYDAISRGNQDLTS